MWILMEQRNAQYDYSSALEALHRIIRSPRRDKNDRGIMCLAMGSMSARLRIMCESTKGLRANHNQAAAVLDVF